MSAPFIIYKSTGVILEGNRVEGVTADGVPYIEVDATLFYVGQHRAGDKAWNEKDLDEMDSTFIPPTGDLDWSVPIQLDHSDSARDTQGHIRKIWRDKVSVHGEQIEGLRGRLRYVGEEAVGKVRAGLWRKLSLSIYRDTNIIREVTVTPFPCLTGATNHHMEDESMAKPATQEAPVAENTQPKEPETKEFAAGSVEAMRAEFAEKSRKQQEQLDRQAKLIEEQGKVIRFAELTKVVDRFSEANKTLPCMREAELALVETLSDEQLALYKAVKESTPELVSFSTLGSQDPEEVGAVTSDADEGSRLAKYFQQSKKGA